MFVGVCENVCFDGFIALRFAVKIQGIVSDLHSESNLSQASLSLSPL